MWSLCGTILQTLPLRQKRLAAVLLLNPEKIRKHRLVAFHDGEDKFKMSCFQNRDEETGLLVINARHEQIRLLLLNSLKVFLLATKHDSKRSKYKGPTIQHEL